MFGPRKKIQNRGLSIIEIVVSIGLLTLLIFGATTLIPRSLNLDKRTENITTAANLAQAQLETLSARDYQTLSVGVIEARSRVVSDPQNPLYAFEREASINFVHLTDLTDSSIDEGLKRITVIVFYPTPFGERSTSISTFIARR
ncbi:MAG: hypothetical protein UX98_C0018G0018 [Parcubacteria group bacterium GW2011_GWA2_47_26]|nr:MAG: hypothetical protein UX98_C0018G0018 [Parcubacteria group bacterium GW2011_GWA2_47_26]